MPPPESSAKFAVTVQSIAVTVESPPALTAPPRDAMFNIIVQPVTATMGETFFLLDVASAPPDDKAEFEVIVQFVAVTVDSPPA